MNTKLIAGTVEMLILDVIAQGPTYGYEIVQVVTERSSGSVELKEGSLYPALHRLERRKLLSTSWKNVDGRRRKYYKLNVAGQRFLDSKKEEWAQFSSGVNGVLGVQLGLA
jgi:PadR family transcriptional regulator PadR